MPILRSSRYAAQRSWLVSLSLHLAAILVLAALLQPAGFGPNRSLELTADIKEPPPEPESLVIAESTALPNVGELLTVDESDVFAESGVATDYASPEQLWSGKKSGSGADEHSRRGSGPGASFFGTVAAGDEFVYVVDISTSMDNGRGTSASQGSRFERAMAELKTSIERLSPSQSFYVILFCEHTRRMLNDDSLLPQPLPATPENKRRLYEWLDTVSTNMWTDPRQALRLGLAMQPSALFLLSDGRFNGKEKELNMSLLHGNPSVSEVIGRHNRGRTPIHTIAYEDKLNCQAMEQIARSTGGEYRFVPPHSKVVRPSSDELAENRAGYLLSRARLSESQGRWKQALAMYRRIERDFPHSDAAKTAATKTAALSAREQ